MDNMEGGRTEYDRWMDTGSAQTDGGVIWMVK